MIQIIFEPEEKLWRLLDLEIERLLGKKISKSDS